MYTQLVMLSKESSDIYTFHEFKMTRWASCCCCKGLLFCDFCSSEKRPSLGSSFSTFQVPSQRDPGLRLIRRAEQDEESKENMDSRAGNEFEKRHSNASNGDMDIP